MYQGGTARRDGSNAQLKGVCCEGVAREMDIFELTILRFIAKEASRPISSGVYSWNMYCQMPVSK